MELQYHSDKSHFWKAVQTTKSPSLHTHSERLSNMDRLPQTFEDHSFTPKPLDTENKGNSCGCYQIVIKGTFVKPENLENPGFLESDTSFPLLSAKQTLTDFA